jgi:bud site selection protein 20
VRDVSQRPYTPLESEAASGTNLTKFLESVEKFKLRKADEELHKEEIETMVKTNNPKEIGLLSTEKEEEEAAASADAAVDVKEVVME